MNSKLDVFKQKGTPKMDGENNGQTLKKMDDLGGKPTIFGNIQVGWKCHKMISNYGVCVLTFQRLKVDVTCRLPQSFPVFGPLAVPSYAGKNHEPRSSRDRCP